MKTLLDDQINDYEFNTFSADEVLWEGTPGFEYNDPMLDRDIQLAGGASGGFTSPYVILGLPIYFACQAYLNENWIALTIWTLVGLGMITLPSIIINWLKKMRQTNTAYKITKDAVHFKLWRYGKISYHKLPVTSISKMVKVGLMNNPNKGSLLFITKPDALPNFWTYDFFKETRRDWPSIELIDDLEHVRKLIAQLKAENK